MPENDQTNIDNQVAKRRVAGRDAVRDAILNAARQGSHQIRICAPMLEPHYFNNEDITSYLASFAASHPRNMVRILVSDGDSTVRYNSRLVGVARKLSDFVQIRRPGELHSIGMEMWMAIDTQGYLIMPDYTKPECVVDLDNRNMAAKYSRQFDEMWQVARFISSINVVGL